MRIRLIFGDETSDWIFRFTCHTNSELVVVEVDKNADLDRKHIFLQLDHNCHPGREKCVPLGLCYKEIVPK